MENGHNELSKVKVGYLKTVGLLALFRLAAQILFSDGFG